MYEYFGNKQERYSSSHLEDLAHPALCSGIRRSLDLSLEEKNISEGSSWDCSWLCRAGLLGFFRSNVSKVLHDLDKELGNARLENA